MKNSCSGKSTIKKRILNANAKRKIIQLISRNVQKFSLFKTWLGIKVTVLFISISTLKVLPIFVYIQFKNIEIKGTVMQIEKALINDRLRVSKVSWKFRIPTIYSLAVIYPWNFPFLKKVPYFLTVSIAFSAYQQTFTVQ